MKNNTFLDKFHWIYQVGFSVILALPLLVLEPWFFPPDWGKTIVFRSILAILLFLFVFEWLYKKRELPLQQLKKNKIIWLLATFFLIFLLATIFSADPYFSLWGWPMRSGGFINLAFYIILAVFSFVILKKEDWSKVWIFSIGIGALVSFIAIVQYYGLLSSMFVPSGRPPSTMGNPILLAIYLLLLFFVTLSYAIKEKNLFKKIGYLACLLLFLYVILITQSRAAYLGLLVGGIYFLLWYPKKALVMKITTVFLLALIIGAIFYVNTAKHYPKTLEENHLFASIAPRLSITLLLADGRFYAWSGIDYQALIKKPVLGYGPENFSVGFNQYYDPSLPYLDRNWGDWWDRAHNIVLDIGMQAGVLAILAYALLLITIFWQLQKTKSHQRQLTGASETSPMIIHGVQATFIAYVTANLFSFDSFSSYLLFFLFIGYSLRLTRGDTNTPATLESMNEKIWLRGGLITGLTCIVAIFLWQYNVVPLRINAQINKARDLAEHKYCGQALGLMDNALLKHSLLDSYARLSYVEFTKICNEFYPENNVAYVKKGLELIGEAVKIQPNYTRYWILLGSSSAILARQEENPEMKNDLLQKAASYFEKALQLAPKYQEIPIEQAKMEIVAGNYAKAQDYSQKCVALNAGLKDCWWYFGIAQIYLKDTAGAQKNIFLSNHPESQESLGELADAYYAILDYQNLALTYEKLVKINPTIAQYHSSLAFFYKELGKYDKARQEAQKVLELSPESKPNVEAFLKTLP